MGTLISIALCVFSFVFASRRLDIVTARNANLVEWRPLLLLAFAVWTLNTAHRAIIWLPQSLGTVSFDGHGHERIARRVASELNSGIAKVSELEVFSNEGYRNFLGVFYWLTDASVVATYAIHGLLAFLALLLILEAIAITIQNRLPSWVVLIVMFLPSAHIFAPWNMKEAPALFGIAVIVKAVVDFENSSKKASSLLLTGIGVLPFILLRPQIAFVWLLAAGLGVGFGKHGFGSKPYILISILCGYFLVVVVGEQLAPGLLGRIQEEGLTVTMDKMTDHGESYGGAVIYRQSTPIPVLSGLVFSMFEPNPSYWGSPAFAIVGIEAWAVSLIAIWNWLVVRNRLQLLFTPTGITCVLALLGLSFYLGYMYNMGLMVRQRLQIMPAMIVLAALPERFRNRDASCLDDRRWRAGN